MPFPAKNNTGYGPPYVRDKYVPLANIDVDTAGRAACSALFLNRVQTLTSAGRWGQTLRLTTPNWAARVLAEVNRKPPLVVISSNRSKWIKAGLKALDDQLEVLDKPSLDTVADLNALTAFAGQTQSPPVYAPKRIGLNRSVYVVVHVNEYSTYKRALANSNIIVVGWEFAGGGAGPRGLDLVGFGASRFAAMEFCKKLRREARAGARTTWNYAWLVDDNVVGLTAFPGLEVIETEIAKDTYACVGFKGDIGAMTHDQITEWARDQYEEPIPDKPGDSKTPNIVQQMSLWNVGYLDTNYLNFGPIYVSSAEDLSISKYFDIQETKYLWYGIGVRKEVTTYDNGDGGNKVNRTRRILEAWMTKAEAGATPVGKTAPPPVQITPADDDEVEYDTDPPTLSEYIIKKVLPNAQKVSEKAGDVPTQNTAKSQAVEQITAKAIEKNLVTGPALAAAFKINGTNLQVITTYDVP